MARYFRMRAGKEAFECMAEIFGSNTITDEQLQQIQKRVLGIFVYFHDFCEEHGLRYFLAFGSCLGAVRHQGFIPWDDDLDILMPLYDYRKLADLWSQYADTARFSYCATTRHYVDRHLAPTIRDNNTTYLTKDCLDLDVHHGMMIEIGPLFACPPTKTQERMQMFWGMVRALMKTQRVPNSQGKATRLAAKLILGVFRSQALRYRLWRYAEKEVSKYSASGCKYYKQLGLPQHMRLKYPIEIFDEAVSVPFEGYTAYIPKGYDLYLKLLYGDYNKLPPEEERKPKHATVYVNTENSYTEYKNIYFLRDAKKRKMQEEYKSLS